MGHVATVTTTGQKGLRTYFGFVSQRDIEIKPTKKNHPGDADPQMTALLPPTRLEEEGGGEAALCRLHSITSPLDVANFHTLVL